jgi:flagellar biosynthesis/type III secretory pathway protein FliH
VRPADEVTPEVTADLEQRRAIEVLAEAGLLPGRVRVVSQAGEAAA